MARFYGEVGYLTTSQTAPGVWGEIITNKNYYGDIVKIGKRYQQSEKFNDDIVVNNQISIVADAFANENFMFIKYIEWNSIKFKVTNVEVLAPRLLLTLGGVYNE